MSEHYKFNYESAVANITCACGEEHNLDSEGGHYQCGCGRTFRFATNIVTEYKAKHLKLIPYWEDQCPTCGEKAVEACRCPLNDRKCPNHHWWRRDKDNNAIMLTGPHGNPLDWEQVDENSRSD